MYLHKFLSRASTLRALSISSIETRKTGDSGINNKIINVIIVIKAAILLTNRKSSCVNEKSQCYDHGLKSDSFRLNLQVLNIPEGKL